MNRKSDKNSTKSSDKWHENQALNVKQKERGKKIYKKKRHLHIHKLQLE